MRLDSAGLYEQSPHARSTVPDRAAPCCADGRALSAQTPPPARRSQQPVFRGGVDLLTVDATVVDREGRQIIDLKPAEFVVEVDGKARPVVSAEYVKLVDDTPVPIGARTGAAEGAAAARRSVLLDQHARAAARAG